MLSSSSRSKTKRGFSLLLSLFVEGLLRPSSLLSLRYFELRSKLTVRSLPGKRACSTPQLEERSRICGYDTFSWFMRQNFRTERVVTNTSFVNLGFRFISSMLGTMRKVRLDCEISKFRNGRPFCYTESSMGSFLLKLLYCKRSSNLRTSSSRMSVASKICKRNFPMFTDAQIESLLARPCFLVALLL